MANLDTATLAPKIAQAKSAGYSDDEIIKFLSDQAPDQFKQATEAGYSASEILGHLTSDVAENGRPRVVIQTPSSETPSAEPPDDHGLARRQRMSTVEKAISPFTEYPRNVREMSTEATNQFSRGLSQLGQSFLKAKGGLWEPGEAENAWTGLKGLGNIAGGAIGAVAAPVTGAYRSVVGQPVEDTTGIPREQTEFLAQLATPGLGFTKFAGAPGVIPRGPMIRPVERPPEPLAVPVQRLNDIPGVEVDLPRAVTGGRATQEIGQGLSHTPLAGTPISEAIHTTLPQQVEAARDTIAAEHGAGTGANVANRARNTLEEAAATEAQANAKAAAEADAKAVADWERAQQERGAAIDTTERQSTQTTQAAVGPELHPQDMGGVVINRTRIAHDAAEARKNALYEEARSLDARISDRANIGVHSEVERTLEKAGIHPDDVEAAGAARAMLTRLERFSETAKAREGLAPVGQTMAEVEQVRQNLNFIYGRATNDADRNAARKIIDAFDDWQVKATRDHLMPGSDPRAHQAMLDARAANRDWRTKFGYNNRDDADKLINKMVTGAEDQHTGSVGVSDALTAGGDKSGPLHRRIMEATGSDPDVAQAIRSGTWNKLTRDAKGEPLPAKDIQKNIDKHLYGTGRDVAERVFTQDQRALMRAHADTVVEAETRRAAAAAEAKATTPKPTKVEPGPIQKLTEQIIGKPGGKVSDEDIFNTLHGHAKKGGDVKTLSRVISHLPVEMRGDLAGAFVRELGIAPGTKQFSLDHFANQWADITPQARAVMFGNAGPHVTALNDIARLAKELKVIKGRFGNPSGSARNIMWGSLGALFTQSPKAAAYSIGAGVAGNIGARILAHPAGASSIRKYMRAVEMADRDASPARMAAVETTKRNLANTARGLATVR